MAESRIQEWSRSVKERDGKCMKCGKLDDLHAHHVKPKSTHPELKYVVENGVTLCYTCHKKEHEANRIRVRSARPQRKTLDRKIEMLEGMVAELQSENRRLLRKVKKLEVRLAGRAAKFVEAQNAMWKVS